MMDLKKLADKFPENDIEWRVQQAGLGKNSTPWALIIPYITNRAIMQRLDQVCGAGNWKNEFKASPCGNGYLCGISIFIHDEWVTRWDGAELNDSGAIDPVKSTVSNSMKRAGVQWGIGRYLYLFDAQFADCVACDNRSQAPAGWNYQYSKGNNKSPSFGFAWKNKPLHKSMLPVTQQIIKEHIEDIDNAETMDELKVAYKYAYTLAESEQSKELLNTFSKAKDARKEGIFKEIEDAKAQDSIKATKFVKQQVQVIRECLNESVIEGQKKLAISQAEKIIDTELQRQSIIQITKAADAALKAIKGKNHANK